MSKIMIVEDDVALREIYSIRITAEGYEVITAGDGEEALARVIPEHPDLILSDVMMPKISGFDMLEIIRRTPEVANTIVVMMTALSSDEQRARGEALGCNAYLVKSQVGIEDVVNTIHRVMNDRPDEATPAPNGKPSSTPISSMESASAPAAKDSPDIPESFISVPINDFLAAQRANAALGATAKLVSNPASSAESAPSAPVSQSTSGFAPTVPPVPSTPATPTLAQESDQDGNHPAQ